MRESARKTLKKASKADNKPTLWAKPIVGTWSWSLLGMIKLVAFPCAWTAQSSRISVKKVLPWRNGSKSSSSSITACSILESCILLNAVTSYLKTASHYVGHIRLDQDMTEPGTLQKLHLRIWGPQQTCQMLQRILLQVMWLLRRDKQP